MRTPKIIDVCEKHGKTEFARETNGYLRCKRCRNDHTIKRRRDVKLKLVAEFGGKCEICKYDRSMRNLTFHHKDATQKDFTISSKGNTIAYSKLQAEAEKCILVCANCHGELHDGLISIPE